MLLIIIYQVGTFSDLCLKSVTSSHYASRLQAARHKCIPEHTNSGPVHYYSKGRAQRARPLHTI